MPLIKSLASAHYSRVVVLILSLNKIMPIYSHYTEKKLVYITITAPFSRQPFSCLECTKLNIYLSCNVQSVSNIKYIFLVYLLLLPQPLDKNTW